MNKHLDFLCLQTVHLNFKLLVMLSKTFSLLFFLECVGNHAKHNSPTHSKYAGNHQEPIEEWNIHCPLMVPGNTTRFLGQSPKRIASLTKAYPDIVPPHMSHIAIECLSAGRAQKNATEQPEAGREMDQQFVSVHRVYRLQNRRVHSQGHHTNHTDKREPDEHNGAKEFADLLCA